MADKNLQMKQRNSANTDWDNLFPMTKAENVKAADGSSVAAHLADNSKHVTNLEKQNWNQKADLVTHDVTGAKYTLHIDAEGLYLREV